MRLTVFASGSTGNCALVQAGGKNVLIDAGISARRVRAALEGEGLGLSELDGILITHEHTDHVSGLSVLCRQASLPVYAPGTVANHLRWSIPGVETCLWDIRPEETFAMGELAVTAFPTPHDTPQSVGYRLEAEGESLAFATDTGCVTEVMRRYMLGADTVLIEANHDEMMLRYGRYPMALKRRVLSQSGHLSNDDCALLAAYLAQNGTRSIVLGHLSRENNTPRKAYETVSAVLGGSGATLQIAPELGRLCVEAVRCCV